MKKVGIFGGTFNPVHREHVEIAKRAVEQLGLDNLLVMPTYISPHKNLTPASCKDRLNMLNLAFLGIDKITVCDYEIKKQGKSYTYETVEHFNDGDTILYFICGGDMLTDFKTWKFPERILKNCTLAVFLREDYATDIESEREYFKQNFGKDFILLDYVGKSDSSSKIRVYADLGLDFTGLTLDLVRDYILERGLYRTSPYADFVKSVLKESRLIHTAGVILKSLTKVKELGLDYDKVYTSALLHDCAKYLEVSGFSAFKLPPSVPAPVVHSFLGAYVAEHVLGVKDKEILDAIAYHTSGKANMSTLGKLIFVADMIEDNRDYDGVDLLRKDYEKDFDLCFVNCIKEETLHLKNKNQPIYFETLNAYNYYVKGDNK